MLFSSYAFIFCFLPITWAGFFWIARLGREAAIAWLVAASLFFYGWWNPVYLWLILGLTLANFFIGKQLGRAFSAGAERTRKVWLTLGIAGNLAVLGWFKYANFAVDTVNALAATQFHLATIVLPLAISFFTFQKIAYLVDAYRGIAREYRLNHFLLFVTFFPQLIAGPIVHHSEVMPQFMARETMLPRLGHIAAGLTIFVIGLFKKAVIADGIAPYASPVFDAAAQGEPLTLFVAWGGALAYTFQLYFDFSGYTDMAIGAARLFGVRLPANFDSPYRAVNIIDFWRRWHMTLSRFLRDYLYIPLGGNRHGVFSRYRNLMLTMLLGGLWHGAGWTFIIWGVLHGAYLGTNHAWLHLKSRLPRPAMRSGFLFRPLGWALTFCCVVVGWVFFRAADLAAAMTLLRGMAGLNGVALPNALAVRLGDLWTLLSQVGVGTYLGGGQSFLGTWTWITVLLLLTLFMPNSQQIMVLTDPVLAPYGEANPDHPQRSSLLAWRPTRVWAIAIGVAGTAGILALTRVSEFLYFQF